jgi:hypothetical protein
MDDRIREEATTQIEGMPTEAKTKVGRNKNDAPFGSRD